MTTTKQFGFFESAWIDVCSRISDENQEVFEDLAGSVVEDIESEEFFEQCLVAAGVW